MRMRIAEIGEGSKIVSLQHADVCIDCFCLPRAFRLCAERDRVLGWRNCFRSNNERPLSMDFPPATSLYPAHVNAFPNARVEV